MQVHSCLDAAVNRIELKWITSGRHPQFEFAQLKLHFHSSQSHHHNGLNKQSSVLIGQ